MVIVQSTMFATYQVVAGVNPTVLYKGDNIRTLITSRFIISNSDSGNDKVSVYLVPPNGVAAITNAVIYQYQISQFNYIEGVGGFVVQPGWSLQVQCTTGGVLVCTISGELAGNPPNQFGIGG